MPKVFLFITKKGTWIFLFYDTDSTETRAHVHIGKKDMDQYCKIWLEPRISVAKKGELTEKQLKQVLAVVYKYHDKLMEQWKVFKKGGKVKMQTINE